MDKNKKKRPAPPPLNDGPKQFERDYSDSGVVGMGADPTYTLDSNDEARTRRRSSMLDGILLAPKRELPSDGVFKPKMGHRMTQSTGFKKFKKK